MARLFNPEHTPLDRGISALDYTYDAEVNHIDDSPTWSRVIKDALFQLFHRHGAIELNAPLLLPVASMTGFEQPLSVRLLDSQGNLVSRTFQIIRHPAEYGYNRCNFPTTA